MRIVVLGIGNILLTDEGVGVRTIEALERDYVLPPEVEVIDGGTCGMEMLEQLENLDGLVVVDCVRANQPPATPILLKAAYSTYCTRLNLELISSIRSLRFCIASSICALAEIILSISCPMRWACSSTCMSSGVPITEILDTFPVLGLTSLIWINAEPAKDE